MIVWQDGSGGMDAIQRWTWRVYGMLMNFTIFEEAA